MFGEDCKDRRFRVLNAMLLYKSNIGDSIESRLFHVLSLFKLKTSVIFYIILV